MVQPVLTLDVLGVIENSEEKLIRILKYFLYNEQSRSYFFSQEVLSFKKIVSDYKTDDEVIDALNSKLEELLLRYYSEVSVSVSKVASDVKFSYLFEITVYGGGVETKLSQQVETVVDTLQPLRKYYKDTKWL